MRRRMLAILAIASLALCVVTAAGWACSYWRADAIGYGGKWWSGEVAFSQGRLFLWTWSTDDPTMMAKVLPTGTSHTVSLPGNHRANRLPGGLTTGHFMMAGVYSHSRQIANAGFTNDLWYFYLPCWQLLLLATILPALWLWRRYRPGARRQRLQQLGLCPTCEYDLRASKERCPECGTAIPAK